MSWPELFHYLMGYRFAMVPLQSISLFFFLQSLNTFISGIFGLEYVYHLSPYSSTPHATPYNQLNELVSTLHQKLRILPTNTKFFTSIYLFLLFFLIGPAFLTIVGLVPKWLKYFGYAGQNWIWPIFEIFNLDNRNTKNKKNADFGNICLLAIFGTFFIFFRLLIPVFAHSMIMQVVLSGVSCGCFFIYFPATLYHLGLSTRKKSQDESLNIGISVALVILFTNLIKVLGNSQDWLMKPEYQYICWIFAAIAIFILFMLVMVHYWRASFNDLLKSKPSSVQIPVAFYDRVEEVTPFWRVVILGGALVANLLLLFMLFSNVGVLARWTDTEYYVLLLLQTISLWYYISYATWNPKSFGFLRPWVIWIADVVLYGALFVVIFGSQHPYLGIPQRVLIYCIMLFLPGVFALNIQIIWHEIIRQEVNHMLWSIGMGFLFGNIYLTVMITCFILTFIYSFLPFILAMIFKNLFWILFWIVLIAAGLPTYYIRNMSFLYFNDDQDDEYSEIVGSRNLKMKKFITYLTRLFIFSIFAVIAVKLASHAEPLHLLSIISVEDHPHIPSHIKLATLNVQFGFDKYGRRNLESYTQLINSTQADIIALQECDTNRMGTGNEDLVTFVAEKLEYRYKFYGPRPLAGTFGTCLLSKYPIRDAQNEFVSSYGAQGVIVKAKVLVPGYETFHIFATKIGHEKVDQKAQMEQLKEMIHDTHENKIILGDFDSISTDSTLYHELEDMGLKNVCKEMSKSHNYIFVSKSLIKSDTVCRPQSLSSLVTKIHVVKLSLH